MKPSVPKGTRDFGPIEMARRNYIFNTVKAVFELHGFQPIETPAMENLSTLLGKYGEEGDKLLFKILNSGDYLNGISENELKTERALQLSTKISEKGLRYDLTVPFARFVVQHRDEITFPFKRYQIQPVWRADRPQKGRYREFYQCDADVVGSNSLLNELELIQIVDNVFSKLGITIKLKINNRKILTGISEIIGEAEKITDITVAIDKLDKIGIEKVKEELVQRGIPSEAIEKLQPIMDLKGSNKEKLVKMKEVLATSEIGLKGVEEAEIIFNYAQNSGVTCELEFDLTLARGLNYYTGAIFEVKANEEGVEMGSISGGGRYDNLTGVFGMEGVSGVGISFGADRIYDVLLQLNKFPSSALSATKVLFVNFGSNEEAFCLPLVKSLRINGISAELFPENAKMKKQMTYADAKQIPYVAMVGENEMLEKVVSIKNMVNGEQVKVKTDDLVAYFK
jgi:histidyl-tRNA synthetase